MEQKIPYFMKLREIDLYAVILRDVPPAEKIGLALVDERDVFVV